MNRIQNIYRDRGHPRLQKKTHRTSPIQPQQLSTNATRLNHVKHNTSALTDPMYTFPGFESSCAFIRSSEDAYRLAIKVTIVWDTWEQIRAPDTSCYAPRTFCGLQCYDREGSECRLKVNRRAISGGSKTKTSRTSPVPLLANNSTKELAQNPPEK